MGISICVRGTRAGSSPGASQRGISPGGVVVGWPLGAGSSVLTVSMRVLAAGKFVEPLPWRASITWPRAILPDAVRGSFSIRYHARGRAGAPSLACACSTHAAARGAGGPGAGRGGGEGGSVPGVGSVHTLHNRHRNIAVNRVSDGDNGSSIDARKLGDDPLNILRDDRRARYRYRPITPSENAITPVRGDLCTITDGGEPAVITAERTRRRCCPGVGTADESGRGLR